MKHSLHRLTLIGLLALTLSLGLLTSFGIASPSPVTLSGMMLASANAANSQSITTSDTVIFKSARAGGSQIDGCTAFTISNDGAVDLYVNVRGHHAVDGSDSPTEYGKVSVGTAVTFTVANNSSRPNIQIDRITVKAASGTATISYMVTERF